MPEFCWALLKCDNLVSDFTWLFYLLKFVVFIEVCCIYWSWPMHLHVEWFDLVSRPWCQTFKHRLFHAHNASFFPCFKKKPHHLKHVFKGNDSHVLWLHNNLTVGFLLNTVWKRYYKLWMLELCPLILFVLVLFLFCFVCSCVCVFKTKEFLSMKVLFAKNASSHFLAPELW